MLNRLLVLLILGGLLPLGARLWWVLDLFTHFRLQFLALALLVLGFGIARRRYRLSALLGAVICLNAWPLLPYLPRSASGDGATNDGAPLVVLSINVEARNPDYDSVIARIRESNAELVALIELSPGLSDRLSEVADLYPYRFTQPANNNFGIAVLSRYPLEAPELFPLGPSQAIETAVGTPGGKLTLMAVHPFPPINARMARARDSALDELAARIRDTEGPVLVCGDFNLTPYSPVFARFEKSSELKNVRRGLGLGFSWPSNLPLLGIPIDHCFTRAPLAPERIERMDQTGSDHYPVRVTLRWQEMP